MKRLFFVLLLGFFVSMTACKQEAKKAEEVVKETATEVKETVEKAVEMPAVEVPEFSSEKVQAFADEYGAYFSKVIAASKGAAEYTAEEIEKEGEMITAKMEEALAEMSAEDTQKWGTWVAKLNEKISETAEQ